MKKITVVEDQKFTVGFDIINLIAFNLRNVAEQHGAELSEEVRTLVKALWQNLHYMAAHTGVNRSNWLINMMANGERIMNVISRDERHWFYDVMFLIQKLAGQNLTNTNMGPHQNYWTSGMTEYSTLESDIFSHHYAKFTLAYVRTYCASGDIVIIHDYATHTYRLGTSNNEMLYGWTDLDGGTNGFMAIKFYVSEELRSEFRHKYSSFYKQEFGYVPCTDTLRKLPFVPSCKMKRMNACYNDKPTYKLVAFYPDPQKFAKATY